ncbi:MAG: hypothetical protein N2C14_06535, partial [Planctomycetales bacterium]
MGRATIFHAFAITSALFVFLGGRATAQEKSKPTLILINNVKIFNGVHDKLTPGSVLIENNLIKSV